MHRQPAHVRTRLALALVFCSAPLVAGDPQPAEAQAPAAASFDIGAVFGAQWVEGELWAGGPGFKAHFDEGGMEFTPALGPTAPRNLPLGLSALSVQRGDTLLWSAAGTMSTPPSLAGNLVEYVRQPGLTERYEVRRDGLEHSLVFDAVPAGEGDLVVRLALDTALAAQSDGAGLRFADGSGGVRYGGVTGVDAAGARVDGAVRLVATGAGAELELSLPASFVSTARYPIVLDPMVTPIFPLVVGSSWEEDSPDVSYDSSVKRWLAVWSMAFSISDCDIRAQTFNDDGSPVPGAFWFLESGSTTVALHPSVGSLQPYNRWLIAWEQRPGPFATTDIIACSISSVFGQSNILIIAGTSADELHPDVGGHSSEQPAVMSVVWEANGAILHRTVFMSFLLPIDLAAVTEVLVAANGSNPRIASSGGASMRLLVVYEQWFPTPAPGDHDIGGVLIDVLGEKIADIAVVTTIGTDERLPDVDGDGNEWGVAWSWANSLAGFVNSVRAERVYMTGSVLTKGAAIDIVQGNDNTEPSVAATGNGYLVAYAKQFTADDYDIAIVGVDKNVTQIIDLQTYVDVAGDKAREPRLGARYASDHADGDGAFLVWQNWNIQTGEGEVHGSMIEPLFGDVTNLGGASAGGTSVSTTSPKVGGAPFQHFYDGLYPNNPVTMFISLQSLGAPFCTGTLHVKPDAAITFALLTNASANVTLNTTIPGNPVLVGLTFYEQWVEKDMLTSPCGKKLQLSNALALTIE